MVERDLTLAGEHTMQYAGVMFQSCTLETIMVLLLMSPQKIQLKKTNR